MEVKEMIFSICFVKGTGKKQIGGFRSSKLPSYIHQTYTSNGG